MRHEIDHKNYPKTLRKKSLDELRFIIKDAGDALAAMPDGPKAGYYADEINYASMEIMRRKKHRGPALSSEWCQCGPKETFGCYPEDGQCTCGLFKHHVHCGTCGKVSQVG